MALVLWKGAPLFGLRRADPWRLAGGSGNSTSTEHREMVLRPLEEGRRALDEQQREFGAFLAQFKRATDREEFDRFMSGGGAGAA